MDSGIKAIIFDLDGVLVDGEGWHEEAFTRAMCDYGYEVSPDVYRKGFSTVDRIEKLSKVGRAPGKPNLRRMLAKLKQKYTKEIIWSRCKPIDRVIEAVDFANTYTGGKIAVATNSSRGPAIEMLTSAGLLPFFDIVITSADTNGKLKPHPAPYLQASYKLGVFSKECLAIDNSAIGIMSAVNAMCRPLRIKSFDKLNVDLIELQLKSLEIRI